LPDYLLAVPIPCSTLYAFAQGSVHAELALKPVLSNQKAPPHRLGVRRLGLCKFHHFGEMMALFW
jgi:hypothetical protein